MPVRWSLGRTDSYSDVRRGAALGVYLRLEGIDKTIGRPHGVRERRVSAMIVRLDHIGVVANSWEEAQEVLLHQMGFTLNEVRTRMPEGNYFAPENAKIYFIDVGSGETQLEILLPQDRVSGMGTVPRQARPWPAPPWLRRRRRRSRVEALVRSGPAADPDRRPEVRVVLLSAKRDGHPH